MAEGGVDEKASGSTPSVFISYASLDSAIAETACEALEKAGVTCWIALRDVTPGAFYGDEIVHAIDATKAIVLILSQNAATSPHVLREVERAASKRHLVISLRIDKAPIAAALSTSLIPRSGWMRALAIRPVRCPSSFCGTGRHTSPYRDTDRGPHGARSRTGRVRTVAQADGARRRIPRQLGARGIRGGPAMAIQPSSCCNGRNNAGRVSARAGHCGTGDSGKVRRGPAVRRHEREEGPGVFFDGLSEELIDMLAKVPDLRVPARTSARVITRAATPHVM